jgi:hypothetical protein
MGRHSAFNTHVARTRAHAHARTHTRTHTLVVWHGGLKSANMHRLSHRGCKTTHIPLQTLQAAVAHDKHQRPVSNTKRQPMWPWGRGPTEGRHTDQHGSHASDVAVGRKPSRFPMLLAEQCSRWLGATAAASSTHSRVLTRVALYSDQGSELLCKPSG